MLLAPLYLKSYHQIVIGRVAAVAFILFVSAIVCRAEGLAGFLIEKAPAEGADSQFQIVPFSEISWETEKGGSITTLSGSSAPFKNADVKQFIYLDEFTWRQLNSNDSFKFFRTAILDREVVIPREHPYITSEKEIHPYVVGSQSLGVIIKAMPGYASVLAPIKSGLDSEIAHYQNGDRKANYHWMSGNDYILLLAKAAQLKSTENWTTSDGKTYQNVSNISPAEDSVQISFDGGVATIPYYQLPLELQKRLKQAYEKKKADEQAQANAVVEAHKLADEQKMQAEAAALLQKQQEAASPSVAPDNSAMGQTNPDVTAGSSSATPIVPGSPSVVPGTPVAVAQNGAVAAPGSPSPVTAPAKPQSGTPAVASVPAIAPTPASPSSPSTKAPVPVAAPAPVVYTPVIPGSTYHYDRVVNVTYLDSPAVELLPVVPATATPTATTPPKGTLFVRTIIEGETPTQSDKVEAVFSSPGIAKKLAGNRNATFMAGGVSIPVSGPENTTGLGIGADQVAFNLTHIQAKLVVSTKEATFNVGGFNYKIDQDGITTLQNYFNGTSSLPPPPTYFESAYKQFKLMLPGIIEFISTTCVYIILSGFGLLMLFFFGFVGIAAGRFFKN